MMRHFRNLPLVPSLCYGLAALVLLAAGFVAFAPAHAAMYDTSDGCPAGTYNQGFINIMGTDFGPICAPYTPCTIYGAGWTGYVPDCTPPPPSCAANVGASCASAANSCSMTGSGVIGCDGSCTATVPSDSLCPVSPPPPTCTGLGYTGGTYPACRNSCADSGQSGAWPSCYTPRSCTKTNSCGMSNTGTTIDAAGDCSVSAPSDSLCPANPPPYSEASYIPPYSEASYAPPYSEASYYSQASYAPASTCGTGLAPSITASPDLVKSGSTSTITWSATGVPAGTKCTITGANVGGAGVNSVTTAAANSACTVATGSKTPTITAQTTYTMTCSTATKSVIVNIVPAFQEF